MTRELDDSEGAQRTPPAQGRPATRSVRQSNLRRLAPTTGGFVVVIGLAVAAAWFGPQPAQAEAAQGATGDQLYTQHCASCHQPGGIGLEGAFPPLAGNPAAADAAYVESTIRDGLSGPLEVLGVSYDAVMPPVVALTDSAEIEEVTSYVVGLAATDSTQDAEPAESDTDAEDTPAEPVVGDVDRGHDLFLGAASFENGGAACAACHTAGSIGNLGGPGLGPDLTEVFDTLGGEVGLSGWMANPPSATMQPLFGDRPLTEAELADVVAFLGDAPNQDPADDDFDALLVAGLVGLVVLIAGMAVAWRGMRQTYRDRLRTHPGGRRVRAGRVATPSATGSDQRKTATVARSSR